MQSEVLKLLDYFQSHVEDQSMNEQVSALISDRGRWPKAKGLFDQVRVKLLKKQNNSMRSRSSEESHYLFLEVCLKTFYNETHTSAPYDSCSPYWIIKNALVLARALELPSDSVVDLVAPSAD
ncbi:MAG: hypothetical protein AAGH99_06660 [Planctomycetota bacterium]